MQTPTHITPQEEIATMTTQRLAEIPGGVQADNLRTSIEWDKHHLRKLIRDWMATHGTIMRPYRRDLCKQAIKHIRIAQTNLKTWGAL